MYKNFSGDMVKARVEAPKGDFCQPTSSLSGPSLIRFERFQNEKNDKSGPIALLH
jgi:hypothetical protein